jgi:hypothetical protein
MSDSTTTLGITDGTARAGERGRPRAAVTRHPLWRGRAARVTAARVAAASTAGVLAVSGLAAASAAAATPASASWRIVKRVHAGGFSQFTAVTALGSRGGWAFLGDNGVTAAYRRSGSSWTKVNFPRHGQENVVAARALSASNAWAFTGYGALSRAVHWNGHRWTTEHTFPGALGSATVISPDNIWVFGDAYLPSGGTYHYNGRSWKHVSSGHGLSGGSASSAGNDWAFGGTDVARWTGGTWKRTSLKHLLPKALGGHRNNPGVIAMYAQSAHSVWVVGDGRDEDQGGPVVVLHYNGHSWKKVASAAPGTAATQGFSAYGSIAPAGHGGLWIPIAQTDVPAQMLHYSGGKIKIATMPVPDKDLQLFAVAAIPGSHGGTLAVGYTHSSDSDLLGTIFQYGG